MSATTTLYVPEAKDIRPRIEKYISRIDNANGKKILIVNVVGWGSRMNEEEAFTYLKAYLDVWQKTNIFLVLLWHGDWLQKGSLTKAIAMYKDENPDNTLLVAVRGPNLKDHADFFNSWKDYNLVLVEVPESERDKAMEKVVQYCPSLPNPKDVKMGAMVHEHARCDMVFALGGGNTTYGEVQVCHAFRNPL